MPKENYNPKNESNKQLTDSHRIFHAWIATLRKNKENKIGGWNVERIWNAHKLLVNEMIRRNINHNQVDPFLDAEKMPRVKLCESLNPRLADIHGGLESFVLIPEFVSVVGGVAEGREDTEDIDLVIKSANRNLEIETKIAEQPAFKKIFPSLHIIYDRLGSHGKHTTAYDLVLVKRRQPTIQEPAYSFPLFGAAPQKAKLPGSHEGIIAYLHREDSQAKMMTEDGEEIHEFPQIRIEACQMIKPTTFVLAGYLGSDGKYGVKDIFRWNSTELVESSEIDRQFFLDKFQWTENIHRLNERVEMEFEEKIQPLKPFLPLKTKSGYGEFEFNSIDDLIRFWAKGDYLKSGVAAEVKFDGFRFIISKKGKEIRIFTEDKKRDRSENLVGIAGDVKSIPADEVILDAEIVEYEDGRPRPRHESMKIIASKEKLTGEIRANVFDCLWYNGTQLTEKPWSQRQEYLKKAIPKDTKYLNRVDPIIAHTEEELRKAAKKVATAEGSEGGMFKVTDKPYALGGRTPFWAKWKRVKEVTVKVIGFRRKIVSGKPTDTFLYRGAFLKNDKLEPLYSQHILGPKDMQEESEWEMGLGFKRGKAGDYGYAETYGSGIKASIGDLITVLPIHILKFKGKDGKERYSHMFPRVRNLETAKTKPDSLEDIENIVALGMGSAKMKLEDFLFNLTEDMFPLTIEEVNNG